MVEHKRWNSRPLKHTLLSELFNEGTFQERVIHKEASKISPLGLATKGGTQEVEHSTFETYCCRSTHFLEIDTIFETIRRRWYRAQVAVST